MVQYSGQMVALKAVHHMLLGRLAGLGARAAVSTTSTPQNPA